MLKIWLPLDGNLENKGCSNVTATQIETPTYVAGKIGQCYQRANSNSQLTNGINLNSNLLDILGTQASVAVWVKPLGTHTHYNGTILSSGNWNAQKWAFGVSQDNSQVDVLCGGYNNYITCAVPVNEWTHLVSTFNNGVCKLYKNGVYVGEKTGQAAFVSDATWTGVGRESYAGGYFGFNGCINDLRIYNHCLSAAEVKEIAQGLVLHYKLDSPYSESSQNLCTAVRPGTAANATWGGHVTQWTNYDATNDPVPFNEGTKGEIVYGQNGSTGGGASRSICRIAASPSTAYTYSCYIKASDNLAYTHANFLYKYEYTAASGGTTITEAGYFNNARKELLSNGWYRIWGTFTTRDTTNGINISFYTYPGKNVTYWLGGWQIEQKDHVTPFMSPGTSRTGYIQDSSGYGHNGTITGNISIASNSGRYSNSTYIPSGNTDYITTPTLQLPGDAITMNFWFKSSNKSPGSGYHMPFEGAASSNQSYEISIYSTGYLRGGLVVSGSRKVDNCTSTKLTDGNWHMCSMTYDGSTIKRYVDGVMEKSTSATGTLITSSYFVLGHYGTVTSYYAKEAYISDVRLYITALSADDILALYHTGAKIDNLGNWHTFEFIESSKESIYKTGITSGHKLYESPSPEFTHYDKTIYIEPDGSEWIRIFHHNNPANGLFTSGSNWEKGVYIDTDRWFDIYDAVKLADKYEFMVKQKTTSSATEVKYRWIQTVSPLTAVYDDVKPDAVTRITTSGYTNGNYGGLRITNSNTHMSIANTSSGNWYGATGCWTAYSGGIPGYPNTTVTSGYMDIYLRIYAPAKIIKNTGIGANHLIEL